jgi:hypothetical protein
MEGGESRMIRAGYLPFVMAFVVAPVLEAGAQNLPWPGNAPTAAPQSQAAVTPAPMSPAPMTAPTPMMGSPMMGSPMMGAPMGGAPMGAAPGAGGGGSAPPCVTEFGRMREDVQKKGQAAKQASEHHVAREELCKLITAYGAAEQKWLKFTEQGVSACGIPPEIVTQLKQVHSRTEQAREKICAAGPGNAAAAAGPSLSEALGTSRPTLETKRAGSNMFDTLTGNAIQK